MSSMRKVSYLHNLIAIANANGAIGDRELLYLRRKAIELGIDENELSRMILNAHDLEIIPPSKHTLKIRYLNECVDMAMADGKLTENELAKCKDVCRIIGLDEVHLQEAITLKNVFVQ